MADRINCVVCGRFLNADRAKDGYPVCSDQCERIDWEREWGPDGNDAPDTADSEPAHAD